MIRRVLTLTFVLTWAALAVAQDGIDSTSIGSRLLKQELETYRQLQQYSNLDFAANSFDDFPLPSDIFDFSYRSPGRAFFYSLLIPGGGQVYTGSKTKAAIFLGVEAALWVGYFTFHSDGKSKEDEYINYAEQNWSAEQYTNWLIEEKGIVDDDSTWYDSNGQPQTFSHHLPDTKNQQYYEMIGKYEQFLYGWQDTDYRSGDILSDLRGQYLTMRDESNDAFGKAKAAAIFSIANHLLSAFEAALAAKKFNRQQDTFSELKLKAHFARHFNERIPQVSLIYKF
jgi:hypothetical protein